MSANSFHPSDHATAASNLETQSNLELSRMLQNVEVPASPLDAQQIIRRSQRRRLPRRIAVGSVLSLAVVGIGIAGITGVGGFAPGASTSSDTSSLAESAETYDATDSGSATDSGNSSDPGGSNDSGGFGISRAPAEKTNLCGGLLAEVAPAASGLEITVDFPDAPASGTSVRGTATVTNTGSDPVSGYSAATPAITLSDDGVVLWHSNGPMIMSIVDVVLAPGESLAYPASFTPVVCSVDDDLGESFGEALPAASPGQYQVSALLEVSTDLGTELVTGPPSTVTLR